MKRICFCIILAFFFIDSQCASGSSTLKICSWNLKDFGNTKSDIEIRYISGILKQYDVVAIQEVVAGAGGTQAVARLADELNRAGSAWDYRVSDPTVSSSYKTEKYAFLWKKSKVTLVGSPWLEKKYAAEIDREPFLATFKFGNENFTLVNFHAITKSMQPEKEVKYLKFLPPEYPKLNLVFLGDFNLPENHSVFNPLKNMGYASVLQGQKTTLRDRCLPDGCLASEYDNIFYPANKIQIQSKGIVHFYKDYTDLEKARMVSDHVPVWCEIGF